ncbi:MAG: TauD/TfdA family dioxygenase [Pseudomonadota bacterium]
MADTAELSLLPTVIPTGAALGADVLGIDLNQPLRGEQADAVRAAWAKHLVLRFRGQRQLTIAGLAAFSANFGALDKRPVASVDATYTHAHLPPEITVISNVKVEGKPIGSLGDGEAVWHADMTYIGRPPRGACLYAVEVPPAGGNTWFANMYQAYDTLPADLKQQIQGLGCVHDASRNSAGQLRNGFEANTDPRKTVGAVHPFVITHADTGRKALLLGRRPNAYVPGLSLEDSETLLDRLWSHATQTRFTWGQSWQVGDVMMWDNTCSMHRRDAFDPKTRRLMYRTQFAGAAVA